MKVLMTKNSVITILLLILLLITHQSFADENEQATSNLDNFTYPTHACQNKPLKPKKPGKVSLYANTETYGREISKYNINVATYNKEIKIYKNCINEYIQRGNQDIKIIRKQLNTALKEARRKNFDIK